VGPNGPQHRVQRPQVPDTRSENIRKLLFVVRICDFTCSGYGYHNLNFVVGPNCPRVQQPRLPHALSENIRSSTTKLCNGKVFRHEQMPWSPSLELDYRHEPLRYDDNLKKQITVIT